MTDGFVTLSVAMCTYNGSAFVAEQLESLAAQSRLPDELVVCDDGSTDATTDIVGRFAASARFPVRVSTNRSRLGVIGNFENAINRCTGEIIALCDQDDVWLPAKLARLERAFDRSEVGLVFSDADIVDEHLRSTGERLWQRHDVNASRRRAIEEGRAVEVLWPGWFVTGATMAFRSRFREILDPIPRDLPMIHDGWIAAVIAGVAAIRAIDEPLIRYRQHPEQHVGARRRAAPGPGRSTALGRVNRYEEQIAIIERLRERLTSQSRFRLRPGVERTIGDWSRHLRVRAVLPRHPLRRVRPVLVELMTGRYHRYSNGMSSAAKDVLVGGRPPRGV